jgi:hypothetical protein
LPVVEVASRGVARLHFHAADWINHDKFIRCWREPIVRFYRGFRIQAVETLA